MHDWRMLTWRNGRRAGFRFRYREVWRFESSLVHAAATEGFRRALVEHGRAPDPHGSRVRLGRSSARPGHGSLRSASMTAPPAFALAATDHLAGGRAVAGSAPAPRADSARHGPCSGGGPRRACAPGGQDRTHCPTEWRPAASPSAAPGPTLAVPRPRLRCRVGAALLGVQRLLRQPVGHRAHERRTLGGGHGAPTTLARGHGDAGGGARQVGSVDRREKPGAAVHGRRGSPLGGYAAGTSCAKSAGERLSP